MMQGAPTIGEVVFQKAQELAHIAVARAMQTSDWTEHPMFGIAVDTDQWALAYQAKLEEMKRMQPPVRPCFRGVTQETRTTMKLTQAEIDALLNASREADEGPTQLVRRIEANVKERCAKVCEAVAARMDADGAYPRNAFVAVPQDGCDECAAEIRKG